MSSADLSFDSLACARELEDAGFTREQAEAQARIFRTQAEAQARMAREQAEAQARELREQSRAPAAALQRNLDRFDEAKRQELATKGDLREMELRLLKWQIGIGATLLAGMASMVAIMARGFNWLGF